MKVAYLLPNLEIGGAENLVLNLLDELVANVGCDFHLLLLGSGGKLAARARELQRGHRNFRFQELGLPYRYGWRPARRVGCYLREHGIGIVHSHLYLCDKTCLFLKLMSPWVRVISTKHCTQRHRFPTAAMDFFSQFLFERIVFVSRTQAHHYRRNCLVFRNTRIIPNGIRRPRRAAAPAAGGMLRIVYVGSLKPEKGPDVLVEALNLLAGLGESFSCDLYGDGPLRASLEAAVRPGAVVRFHAGRPGIADAIGGYDLAVIPSRREGFCLVMVECFAAEVPVLASDDPVLLEMSGGGERADHFRSGDASDLADRILAFSRDIAQRRHKVPAARAHAEAFAIESTARSYMELYRGAASPAVAEEGPG